MSRPRKPAIDTLCDIFIELSVEQQDGALVTLAAIHRQAARLAQQMCICGHGRTKHFVRDGREGCCLCACKGYFLCGDSTAHAAAEQGRLEMEVKS
jgi:hypothetical protein